MINKIIETIVNNRDVDVSIICIVLLIIVIFIAIYNRIKFLCLEKAVELIQKAEKIDKLTGKEKFTLVMNWITNDFPIVFKNSLSRTVLEKLVQFAYDYCFKYMKNYVKRKTGLDIGELIDIVEKED